MKKTISLLLVFSLFAFSLFSTGCGSSGGGSSSGGSNIGGFKFHGAVVDIDVVASSGGTATPAVFAANVRGDVDPTSISAKKTKVKVSKLDAKAPDLRGTPIYDIAARFDDNKKLSCTTDRLQVGEYLFEVYNSDKVFLRAILHVDGFSNDLTLKISPETEIKTAVYKEWVANAPVTSVENFELNLTAALKTEMATKAVTYEEKLATWNPTTDTDLVGTVPVSDINVPTVTKVTVTNIPDTTRPAELQSATWTTITAADIFGEKFGMRYIFDTDTKTWIKFTNEGTGTDKLPFIVFSEYQYDSDHQYCGYYRMGEYFYTEETMDAWEPNENNEFEIPDDAIGEYWHSFYKVLSDSKVEVIDVRVDGTLVYDARITVYNGKTYLRIRNMDEIYELIP